MTIPFHLNRRSLLAALGGLAASAIALETSRGQDTAQTVYTDTISVLGPTPPDPAPPIERNSLVPGLQLWEARNRATVKYELAAVENIRTKLLINFQHGQHFHDLMYCAGWAQELSGYLLPLDSLIGSTTRADLSPWALTSFQWAGKIYGIPIVSNPMILFGNQALMDTAGIDSMPQTWDDLVNAAASIARTGGKGWTMAGGQTGGLGGLFTSWQIFFLQAGGELFDANNRPLFASDAGVAAIEMLQRLLPYSDDLAMYHTSLLDATVSFMRGEIGFMANWAVMYRSLTNPAISAVSDSLITGPLPVGPVGNGSVDSGDGWTVDARTWVANKSMSLIRFFLEPAEQLRMYERTGWLPASLTALANEELLRVAPHASAVQEQMRHRIDSGFRPDYDVVSAVIGSAIQSALNGETTPIAALRSARDQLIRTTR